MDKVRLKFKSGIPIKLQNILAAYGFSYHSSKLGEWIMYQKVPEVPEFDNSGLSKAVQGHLRARINKIEDAYIDPYAHVKDIKEQCLKMADTLPALQAKWVLDWVTENLDNLYSTPPWEDEDHVYNC